MLPSFYLVLSSNYTQLTNLKNSKKCIILWCTINPVVKIKDGNIIDSDENQNIFFGHMIRENTIE